MVHFFDTIVDPVRLRDHALILGSDLPALEGLATDGRLAVWGCTVGSRTQYDKLRRGDPVVFAGAGAEIYTGTVSYVFTNPELATRLGSTNPAGQTWELMYAITGGRFINVPKIEINRAVGYSEQNPIQALVVLDGEKADAVAQLIKGSPTTPPPKRPTVSTGRTETLGQLTDPDAVRASPTEYDQWGRLEFLEVYGYEPSQDYFLQHEGRLYDSKPILSRAYG